MGGRGKRPAREGILHMQRHTARSSEVTGEGGGKTEIDVQLPPPPPEGETFALLSEKGEEG